jgi:ABC-type Fe3+-siderophore transport system permease subunit
MIGFVGLIAPNFARAWLGETAMRLEISEVASKMMSSVCIRFWLY